MILCRPENPIPRSHLAVYASLGWWAQFKMNGTYTQVTTDDGHVTDTRNRHDQEHKAWRLTDASSRVFERVAARTRGKWTFVAELMHSKGGGFRDTHYIHDVIRAEGKLLVGKSYRERWELLGQVFGTEVEGETPSHWVLDDNAWLAKSYKTGTDFAKLFDELDPTQGHEGLVLKNPQGLLSLRDNSGWAVKCRLPNKNLGF